MNRIIEKASFINLFNYLLPGMILTFELYYVIPVSLQTFFQGHASLGYILFISLSLVIGILNDGLAENLIEIFQSGKLLLLIANIWEVIKKSTKQLFKLNATKEKDKGSKDQIIEDQIEEDSIINDQEDEDTTPFIDLVEQVKKEANKEVQLDYLYNYVQKNHMPSILDHCTYEEMDEYIYLFLLNSTINSKLADFIVAKKLVRNLCSLCILAGCLLLFMRLSGVFLIKVLYKIIMICILVFLGYIFNQEYKGMTKKVNRYSLIWFLQLKEDPKYAKEMGLNILFEGNTNSKPASSKETEEIIIEEVKEEM